MSWCALCGLDLGGTARSVRQHERARHARESFRCITCNSTFSCSDDLRKHSRKKAHEIPVAFGKYLCSVSNDGNDLVGQDVDEEDVEQDDVEDGDRFFEEETFVVAQGVPSRPPPSAEARCALCGEVLSN